MPLFVPRSGESWRDPWPAYAELREHHPVHHVTTKDGQADYWVLSRFRDVFEAARDTATFSSARGLTMTTGEGELDLVDAFRPMVMQDPPEHTVFRRMVSRGFTPRQVTELEPQIRAFVRDRLSAIRESGSADIVRELLKPLPSMIVAHYLGVPEADRPRFDGWTEAIVAANSAGDPAESAGAAAEMYEYFTGLIERRRREPGEDTISHLVRADDDDVSVLQMLGFAFTMVAGGNDTTTGLLGVTLQLLTEHPDQRRLLLDDRTRIPEAVEELLRLASPVQGLARTTTREVEFEGGTLPEGT